MNEFVATTGYHRKHASALLKGKRRLYFNHFIPLTESVKTERHGSRIQKIYDEPKTPYQGVLDSPDVSDACKKKLRREHAKLDVVDLKREWDRRLTTLLPTPQSNILT